MLKDYLSIYKSRMSIDYRAEPFPVQTYECIVDMRAISYIKENMQNLDLGDYYDEKRPTGQKVISCKSEPMLILNFLNSFKRVKGTNWGRRVDNYRQCKTNPRRMTTETMSLQGISREIRHTLCRLNQYDLDIVNCHPEILKNWCEKKGIVCSQLEDFNKNRKERFQQVKETMEWDKEQTKTYVLRLINGGGITGSTNGLIMEKLHVLDWFHPLIQELKTIRTHVYRMYPDLAKKAIKAKGKDYYNLQGVCLSYLLTNLENQILNVIINGCVKRGVKLSATIYDGLQPYKDTVPDLEDLMRYLESEILENSGYTLKITEKEMDLGFAIPEDYVDPETRAENDKQADKELKEREKQHKKELQEQKKADKEAERANKQTQRALRQEEKEQKEREKKTDLEYAEEFLQEKRGEILYDKRMGYGYVYNPLRALWNQFKTFDSLDESVIETIGLSSAKEVRNVNMIIKRLIMNREDDLTQFNMKTGILALKHNLVIDMRTLKVRDRTKEDYCSFFLDREYEEKYDKEWCTQYMGQLLKTDNQEYINQVFEIFGYAFTGENNLKIILMLLGKGDNGKSLFIEIVKSLMEQYSTVANTKIFKKPRFENNTHEAHLYPLIGKRGAFISELAENDEFNATVMKRASGNDADSIRNSGSELTIDTTLKAVLIAVSNEVPKNTDPVLWKRLKFIDFPNTFERSAEKEAEIKSHKQDLFCAFMEGANRYYNNNMFIRFVKEIEEATQRQKDSKDSFLEFTKEYEIEISNDGKEYCKDIYQIYSDFCRRDLDKYKKDGKETFYTKFEKQHSIVKEKDNKGNYYKIKI